MNKSIQSELTSNIKSSAAAVTAVIGFLTSVGAFVKAIREDSILYLYAGLYSFIIVLWVSFIYFTFSTRTSNRGNISDRNKESSRFPRIRRLYPLNATILALMTVLLLVYTIKQYRYEKSKIDISGLVVFANGDPIDGAIVTVHLQKGDRSATTSNGKFAIAKIDIEKEPTKVLPVEVKWKQVSRSLSIDVSKGAPNDFVVKLPVGNPPYTITYYRINGLGAFLLAKGEINKKWAEKLSGQPFIVPNSIYDNLNFLISKFSALTGVDFIGSDGEHDDYRDEELSRKYNEQNLPIFIAAIGGHFGVDLSYDDFTNILSSKQLWNVSFEPYQINNKDWNQTFSFWRYIRRSELEHWLSRTVSDLSKEQISQAIQFYKHVTRENDPGAFSYFSTFYDPCGDDGGMAGQVITRDFEILVGVFENISTYPISIGDFAIKENKTQRLRTRSNEKDTFKSIKPEKRNLFPKQILLPGERILIPIESLFSFHKGYNIDSTINLASNTGHREQLALSLQNITSVQIPLRGDSAKAWIDYNVSDVLEMLNNNANISYEQDYLYGPSIKIDNVVIDDATYEVRGFDPKLVVIQGGLGSGSCPFIYTYSLYNQSWKNEGHVLYGINDKKKESFDEIALSQFDGIVKVVEHDPETSFIDTIYIKVVTEDGKEIKILPINKALLYEDKQYLIMNKGDQLEVSFEAGWKHDKARYFLVAKGYYLPYKRIAELKGRNSSPTRRSQKRKSS